MTETARREVCPRCQQRRLWSEFHLTMVGSFPIACTTCTPEPPRQEYRLNQDGAGAAVYRSGSVLLVDGEVFLELR